MKRSTYFLALLVILVGYSRVANAQYYFYNGSYYDSPLLFEVGASVGAMNCLTDLGGKKGIGKKFFKDLNMGNTHISGGVFAGFIYKNAVAVRAEWTYGQVSAYDSILSGVTDIARERYNRNLSFKSTISEIAVLAEIHPLFMFIDWEGKDQDPPRYSPYLVAGVGYFSFNPQTQLNGSWIDLQPLRTEGQGFAEYPERKVYKLKQTNIPLGIGLKYELSPLLNLRGEVVYRKLNTDYLDDVSTTYIDPSLFYTYLSPQQANTAMLLADRQKISKTGAGGKRGSEKEKDGYFTINLKLSLIIGREKIR
jgi:hypothetical protein